MKEPELVSPTRIERLLQLACVYNVPISVTADSAEGSYRYKSRMFEMKRVPGTGVIIIDQPVTDGPAIALTPNTNVTVFFALDDERFLFETKVLRKIMYAYGGRKNVSCLEIAYPNILKNGQRRLYYRVTVPQGKPIEVECGVVGDVTGGFVQEPGLWNFPSPVRFEGSIKNISVGGMLLALKKGGRGRLRIGSKLGMRFSVSPDETPLVLKGIIRRTEKDASTEEDQVALEFIDTTEKFEYKLAINRLYRYVAERKREITAAGAQRGAAHAG